MRKKELRHLNRAELLELLLEQTREKEMLQERLAKAEARLRERDLKISTAGDLAQAVLAVNDVIESAQAAAAQYLENIQLMEKSANERCKSMIAAAEFEAEMIREKAKNDSNQYSDGN